MATFTVNQGGVFDPEDDIVCTITSTEAPTSAELVYRFYRTPLTIQPGATSSAATLSAIGYDGYSQTGAGRGIRWDQNCTLYLRFPTEAEGSQVIQISPTLGIFYAAGAKPWPGDSRHEKITPVQNPVTYVADQGDEHFFRVEFGGISSISDVGVLVPSTVPLQVARSYFRVGMDIWSAIDRIDISVPGVGTVIKTGVR